MKHRHHHNRRLRLHLKKILPFILILPLLAGLVYGFYQVQKAEALYRSRAAEAGSGTRERLTISWQGKTYALREDLMVIALFGIDDAHGTSGSPQCDFITLMVLQKNSPDWKLFHLNRDTMCPITILNAEGKNLGTQTAQLALAHAYGSGGSDSCRNTVKAIESLLYGIHVDQYIRIDLQSIGILNDIVGGVTVQLDNDFSQWDSAMTKGARLKLNAAQAELFVRSRKGMPDSSNTARMERQQLYMKNWLRTAKEAYGQMGGEEAANSLSQLGEHLYSNIHAGRLTELADTLSKTNAPEILTIPGTVNTDNTFAEFYPDEAALQQLVIDTFYYPIKE